MTIPPADIDWFADQFAGISRQMLEAWETTGRPVVGDEPPPDLLFNAMQQLIELLKIIDQGGDYHENPALTDTEPDLNELGDYGLSILEEFVTLAEAMKLNEQIPTWEQLSVALGRWIVTHEGEISILASLVNGLANIANHTDEKMTLEDLYTVMTDFVEAAPSSYLEDLTPEEYLEPWQILIFNRAIIATRIFSPRLMDDAFNAITEYFPDEAPDFFKEGMEQLDIQGYPPDVREVMERYYRNWPLKRTLH